MFSFFRGCLPDNLHATTIKPHENYSASAKLSTAIESLLRLLA